MSKTIAILQSNYIPWKGYFDLINAADEFVFYDTVQFTKNDWRNRNKIKTPQGVQWISVPVSHHFGQSIQETLIGDDRWSEKHWRTISQCYAKAPYFSEYKGVFQDLYTKMTEKHLSQVNYRFIREICDILGIRTRLSWSSDYAMIEGKTARLVDLCQQLGGTEYLSGPAAMDYLEDELFEEAGIKLSYIDYSGYPEYNQLYPPFEHGVSIIDLIFSEGPNAPKYMKSFSATTASGRE